MIKEERLEQRLLDLKTKLQQQAPVSGAAKTNDSRELDVQEAEEIISEAIILMWKFKELIKDIKALVKGVKWYQFMKLASIVQGVAKMIKEYEWSIK